MIYLELFWSFFQIGLFSIGGGYAALPLIREQVTEIHHWLDMTAFIDIVTISQMTPGPIAINAATFVGTQVGGLPGAVIATVGCVTPSCIIVPCVALLQIPPDDGDSGRSGRSPAGRCITDRFRRAVDPDHCFLDGRRRDTQSLGY